MHYRKHTLHAKHIYTLHVKGDLSRQAGERHWARYLTGTGASLQALCGSSLALRLFGGLICSEGPMLGELQISGLAVMFKSFARHIGKAQVPSQGTKFR